MYSEPDRYRGPSTELDSPSKRYETQPPSDQNVVSRSSSNESMGSVSASSGAQFSKSAIRTELPRTRQSPVSHSGAQGRSLTGRISRLPANRASVKRGLHHAARKQPNLAKRMSLGKQPSVTYVQPTVSVTHGTEPDSSPISEEELAGEVKGIYAGLVMVEAKCISMDAAQAADPKTPLGPEQWQALIALHRTLLYEHHDFLMATQHPSAPATLRGLAIKYSMPARMWKHGIHAFLEVLRHRRPDSQDYMLAFIYLAYQMMALLFDTIPAFTDTWIECLGDLARYRMAIEEEKEAHATWGGVAARWYSMASDRHPAVGRLYHHLGILERPSLRKLCLYTKSLTCVIPFPNARDSLATLCTPIVQSEQAIESSSQSLEARVVTFHALIYSNGDPDVVDAVGSDALHLLYLQAPRLRDIGAYLAVTNIAALLEPGSTENVLTQLYSTEINLALQRKRPSMTAGAPGPEPDLDQAKTLVDNFSPSPSLIATTNFCFLAFNMTLRSYEDISDLRDCLPFVHSMLVFLHSLHSLQRRLNDYSQHTFPSLVDSERISWDGLACFLNSVLRQESIDADVLECARKGVFPYVERKEAAHPLAEDFLIRGLIWGQYFFNPGFFDAQTEDDGRMIETPEMHQARAERVVYLGGYLAYHTDFMSYDSQRKTFSATATGPPPFDLPDSPPEMEASNDFGSEQATTTDAMESETTYSAPRSPLAASTTTSDSDEGFTIVSHKEATLPSQPHSKDASIRRSKATKPKADMQPTVADQDTAIYVEEDMR